MFLFPDCTGGRYPYSLYLVNKPYKLRNLGPTMMNMQSYNMHIIIWRWSKMCMSFVWMQYLHRSCYDKSILKHQYVGLPQSGCFLHSQSHGVLLLWGLSNLAGSDFTSGVQFRGGWWQHLSMSSMCVWPSSSNRLYDCVTTFPMLRNYATDCLRQWSILQWTHGNSNTISTYIHRLLSVWTQQ